MLISLVERRVRDRRMMALVEAVLAGGSGLYADPLLLRALHIALDPISAMALPVVLGIAVDDGVHLVHRYLAEGGDVARAVASSGRAVVLTSVTTLAGFSTLCLAHHPGLVSFAAVLSVGVAAALVFSLLVLPPALSRFGAPRQSSAAVLGEPVSPASHD